MIHPRSQRPTADNGLIIRQVILMVMEIVGRRRLEQDSRSMDRVMVISALSAAMSGCQEGEREYSG